MIVEAQAAAQSYTAKLAEQRIVLTMDMLASLKAPSVRHEMSFDRVCNDGQYAHFFTINGVLNGKKVHGALFAGECVLIFAPNVRAAAEIAKTGIRDTVRLAHEYYKIQKEEEANEKETLASQGTIVDVGGRRISSKHAPPLVLAQKKKMEAIIHSVFGGTPFVW